MRRVLMVMLSCCLALPGCMGSGSADKAHSSASRSTGDRSVGEPMTDEAFIGRVSTLMQEQKYPAAIELAREHRSTLEAGPSSDLALLVEADALRLSGKAEEAWELFQTVASPDSFPAPWTRTGMDILYDLGRRDEGYDFCAENIARIPQAHLRRGVRQMCIQRGME